jgi:hypothetical protein
MDSPAVVGAVEIISSSKSYFPLIGFPRLLIVRERCYETKCRPSLHLMGDLGFMYINSSWLCMCMITEATILCYYCTKSRVLSS